MKISTKEVALFAAYIFKISGITLNKSKGYLVENRLKPLLSDYGCTTYLDLYKKSQADKSGNLKRDIIDAISTNETFFFRDTKPFDLLRNKIIPELIDHRRSQGFKKVPIRIWSAACSTGQEVYSIAMLLHDILPNLNDFDITILGTDISALAVQRASYGKYNRFEIQRGLSKPYKHKYFQKQGDEWRVKDTLRVMAQFKKINLLHPFTDIRSMDIVFCRNVAIYFNPADKKRLFTNIAKVMTNDGALIVGGSETLTNVSDLFQSQQYLRTIFYTQKNKTSLSQPSPRPSQQAAKPQKKPLAPPSKPKKIPQKAIRPRQPLPATRTPSSPVVTPRADIFSPEQPLSGANKNSPAQANKTSLLSILDSSKRKKPMPSAHLSTKKKPPKKSLLALIAEKNKTKQ